MRAPLVAVYLKSLDRLQRRLRVSEQERVAALYERDELAGLLVDIRSDYEEMTALADGWRRRAVAMADHLDGDLVRVICEMQAELDRVESGVLQ